MAIDRRNFIAALASTVGASWLGTPLVDVLTEATFVQPAFSITPVVGDGKWIWREPPDETGYLEPREFEVSVGMKMEGRGDGQNLISTTVAPVQFPEQKILDVDIETTGCSAKLVPLSDSAGQLVMHADSIANGQTVSAFANYKVRIFKSHFGFEKTMFPAEQNSKQAPKEFLKNSPGIKMNSTAVKNIGRKTADESMHPWDKAKKFYQWVWENIEGIPGKYTSVEEAISKGRGDCEERACTFIALCRNAGIPARQVWVPSHVWAEIAMCDEGSQWHWIPVHTAAYSWFGFTGAHELVLQKGDRVRLPRRSRTVRLIDDWYQLNGAKPKIEFISTIKPVEPGPGTRQKQANGQWTANTDSRYRRSMRR